MMIDQLFFYIAVAIEEFDVVWQAPWVRQLVGSEKLLETCTIKN